MAKPLSFWPPDDHFRTDKANASLRTALKGKPSLNRGMSQSQDSISD